MDITGSPINRSRSGNGKTNTPENINWVWRPHDLVDALGLIGQLLDRITAGQKPKPPDEKKRDPYREAFEELHDWSFKLL